MSGVIQDYLDGKHADLEQWLEAYDKTEQQDPVNLSPLGHRQAEALGAFWSQAAEIKDAPNLSFFVSPYLRCCQTAAPLAKALGMKPKLLRCWHETGGAGGHDLWAPGGHSTVQAKPQH